MEAYHQLLDKLMAWGPDLQNDLRDATCISRTWTPLPTCCGEPDVPRKLSGLKRSERTSGITGTGNFQMASFCFANR